MIDEKRIAEIRERADEASRIGWVPGMVKGAADDIPYLFSEIESLQAQLAEFSTIGLTPGDIKDLRALCEEKGLTKYIELIVRAKREIVMNNDVIMGLDERIDQLESQLAESQRREQAAVEDVPHDCHTCAFRTEKPCTGDPGKLYQYKNRCKDWQWRGPQEAGDRP